MILVKPLSRPNGGRIDIFPPHEPLQALGKCARSTELDFDEAVRRALSGETPGQNPPPLRTAASAVSGDDSNGRHPTQDDRESSSTGKGGGVDRRGSAEERQRRGSEAAEAKSEEKQGGARGGARRDSGDGKRRGSDEGPRGSDTGGGNSGDGGDDKVRRGHRGCFPAPTAFHNAHHVYSARYFLGSDDWGPAMDRVFRRRNVKFFLVKESVSCWVIFPHVPGTTA